MSPAIANARTPPSARPRSQSGHDTSYRLEKKSANLATIDLNALLYKYETDIATAIRDVFNDSLDLDDDFPLAPFPINEQTYATDNASWPRSTQTRQSSAEWFERAAFRKQQIDKYLWNDGQKLYYDYDTVKKRQSRYESATSFWPLWAGCASEDQALKLVYVCCSRPPSRPRCRP